MNRFWIYLQWKFYRFSSKLIKEVSNYKDTDKWWSLFYVFFLFAVIALILTNDFRYLLIFLFSFLILVIITIHKEYKVGEYMNWHRQKYKELIKDGK